MGDTGKKAYMVQDEDVCRDFLRNVCSRGRKCRFKHPAKVQSFGVDTYNANEERAKFIRMFCHDFQNSVCNREECKFLHCSKEDEEYFCETGSLSQFVVRDAISKSFTPSLPDEGPVCRDYLSGECRRGKACRFRHLTHSKYRKELDVLFGVESQGNENTIDSNGSEYSLESKRFKLSAAPSLPCVAEMPYLPVQGPIITQGYFPHEKCKVHGAAGFFYSPDRCTAPAASNHFNGTCRMGHPSAESQLLVSLEQPMSMQEENSLLKKRVMEMKKQLSDLTAANEFLLDQNAQLRLSRKNGGVTPVVTVQPMPQAAGQLVASTSNGQIMNASTQQLVTAAVPVSIAQGALSGSGQQIISTGTLSTVTVAGQTSTGQLVTAAVPVSCNATGQIMAAVSSVTVAGQNAAGQQLVATAVPVSCTGHAATPTAQQLVPVSCTATGQQLSATRQLVPVSLAPAAVPVSLATVSVASVHIPPPIVTVAQPPNSGPTLSGPPPQSLVTYPIMTQAVLQTSLQR